VGMSGTSGAGEDGAVSGPRHRAARRANLRLAVLLGLVAVAFYASAYFLGGG